MLNPSLNVETVIVNIVSKECRPDLMAAYCVEAGGACSIRTGLRIFLMDHWAMSTDWEPASGTDAQAELERQNSRLQLLLNLTSRITSNLELQELLRSISANIREVMHCDAVAVALPEPASESFRICALDFPGGKGFLREDMLQSPIEGGPPRRAVDTLKPVNAASEGDIGREDMRYLSVRASRVTVLSRL